MTSQSFRPRTRTSPYTPGHSLLSSDDPALTEEAQLLLSRFTRYPSSQASQRSQVGTFNKLGTAAHNYTTSCTTSKANLKDNSESVDDWESGYICSGRSTPEQRPAKHTTRAIGTPASGGPSGKAQHQTLTSFRHCRRSPASIESGSSFEVALPKPCSTNSISTMPNHNRRPFYSPSRSADRESLSPSASKPKSPVGRARRSIRARNAPTNYYRKIHLYQSASEEEAAAEEEEEEEVSSNKKTIAKDTKSLSGQHHDHKSPESRGRNKGTHSSTDAQKRIIYSSPGVQIFQSSFKSLDDFKDLKQACYLPESNPADYARRYGESESPDKFLHVDFDPQEMTAILNLLSLSGCIWSPSPEVSLSDQVIGVISTQSIPKGFAKRIQSMCKLHQILSEEGISDSKAWLLDFITSNPDRKKLPRSKRYVKDLLKSQDFNGSQSALLYDKGKEIQALASCLQYASILSRRQWTDIDEFFLQAKSGRLPSVPHVIQAAELNDGDSSSRCRAVRTSNSLNRLLQGREQGGRELGLHVQRQLRTNITTDYKLFKTWKGASNDVNVLAWSPDGTMFAAGATAQCDVHNIAYNRGNNLVIGDLTCNRLEEVPDHSIPRPSGGATHSQTMSDPRLFMSVSAMQWFDDTLYTASYDNTVKLWKFPNHRASCYQTLRHESKVEVMARSNFEENLLATGTQYFRLWNTKESAYTSLEISKKDKDLTPTSLAWGTINATKDILLAGMSERDDGLPQNGFLAAWRVNEATTTAMTLWPNSQNIFDIKWHPTRAECVTASTIGLGQTKRSKSTKSAVRIYNPLSSRSHLTEFECPALDINDVTFCPMNPHYVTASCTDGVTYVWDYRNPSETLLELSHDDPLNQIDENLSREQADIGVRMALWGNEITQFYTGASDGVVKQWDILRSQEDALVRDLFSFNEEIMCGAFSEDKSNLLIGDAAGGVHILSSGPFSNDGNKTMNFKRAPQPQCSNNESDSESGVNSAKKLLLSGRLIRHPIYGVGQGPHYDGPFAAWARPENTPQSRLRYTSLTEEWRLRQLDGPVPRHRPGLDEHSRKDVEAQILLAQIRNQRRDENKRKRTAADDSRETARRPHNYINLCSDEDEDPLPPLVKSKKRTARSQSYSGPFLGIANMECEVIDLTGDSDPEDSEDPALPSSANTSSPAMPSSSIHFSEFAHILEELEEDLKEDFWWPPNSQINANIQDTDI